jgi:hypothetical protein
MHVSITPQDAMPVAANIPATGPGTFASEGASWLFLIGSPHLATRQVGEATLVTARHDLARARELVPLYTETLGTLRRYLPHVPVEGLTLMVLGEEAGLPEGTPPSDGRAVVVISRPTLAGLDRPDPYDFPWVWDALIFDLWRIGNGKSGGHLVPLVRETAQFIWLIDRYDGDMARLTAEVNERMARMPDDLRRAYLTPQLLDLYGRRGEAGVAAFLTELHIRSAELSTASDHELQVWWQETIDGL